MQIRPRLRHEHFNLPPALDGHPNHAQRSADSAGGQRSGIALRHHAPGHRHQFRAVAANGQIGVAPLLMNLQRLGDHRFAQTVHSAGAIAFGVARRPVKNTAAALDGPKKIDGRRTRLRKRFANRGKFRAQFRQISRARSIHAHRQAHRRGHSDRWGAANHHIL